MEGLYDQQLSEIVHQQQMLMQDPNNPSMSQSAG